MSKISVAEKNGVMTITNKLTYPENINRFVYNSIKTGMHKSFVPVTSIEKGKEIKLECVVRDLIPLSHYFNGIVPKKMFLYSMHQLALVMQYCENNNLNVDNVCLNTSVIFIEPHSNRLLCIYWPIVNNHRSFPCDIFFKQIAYELKFNPNENQDYLITYKAFFNGIEPFSIGNFIKMLITLEKMDYNAQNKAPIKKGEDGGNAAVVKPAQDIAYDPFAILNDDQPPAVPPIASSPQEHNTICAACGRENKIGAKFCASCGKALVYQDATEKTVKTADLEKSKIQAEILAANESANNDFSVVLIRNKTQKVYEINKPCFKIGSARDTNDLYIDNNSYVSRHHAEIHNKNGRYFIVDKKSMNKTFVDGKELLPETETEIFIGAKIRFVNEDFIFTVKPSE